MLLAHGVSRGGKTFPAIPSRLQPATLLREAVSPSALAADQRHPGYHLLAIGIALTLA
jgi:hypothetical protein